MRNEASDNQKSSNQPPPAHPAYGVFRAVTSISSVVLANNPSALTLDGTNTWILRAPGSSACILVDPGPNDEQHIRLLATHGPVSVILLTHKHADHTGGARQLAELVNAPIRAIDPALCLRADPLRHGETIAAAGLELEVLATHGHTADSCCFLVQQQNQSVLLTGDTILGTGTTFVELLGDYLNSLQLLAELPLGIVTLPGHGPELPDAALVAKDYLAHRRQRLAQVRAAFERLGADATPEQVVELVYPGLNPELRMAAQRSAQAQLDYLRAE